MSGELLLAYAQERAEDAEAWSVEAHVVACSSCRGRLVALFNASPLAGVLATSWHDLAGVLPGSDRRYASRQPLQVAWKSLGRWPWLTAVVVSSVVALGLARMIAIVRPDASTVSLTWALVPMVALAGVALTFTRRSDPWAEVVLSTPTQGLALVLWRCAVVLLVAAPLTVVAGRILGDADTRYASAGMPLVAMLALTLLALALGTHTGLEVATGLVAGAWSILTVLPLVLAAGEAWVAPSPGLLPAWAVLMVVSAAWVLARRVAFERLAASPFASASAGAQ